jgi:integrase
LSKSQISDVTKIYDGKLVLFRRNDIWQARVHIGGGRYLLKSLKTRVPDDARRIGEEFWHNTRYELSKGIPVQKRTLSSVLDEYVGLRERDNAIGKTANNNSTKYTSDEMLRQVRRVQHFWREYAGSRAVDSIDEKVLSNYVPWRRAYYHNMPVLPRAAKLNPTDKTLQWEMMFGKMVLRYAMSQGYFGNKSLPKYSFTPKVNRVRPDFTISAFELLKSALISWIDKADSARKKAPRQLLHDYVLTLALSGMRIGEANNLKVGDVQPIRDDLGRENVQFRVRGKTGARVVVPHIDAKKVIDDLLVRRGNPDANEWLFAMADGGKILNLWLQFDILLKTFSLSYNAAGVRHSLYSLRHFYAVRAITRDIDVYTIARNMGTSVQMIEMYYGRHATTTSRATRLGGEPSRL